MQKNLTQAYRKILSEVPLHWFDRSRVHEAEFAKLSGLFLPGTSVAYERSRQRIMVVGRETRRWNVVSSEAPFRTLDDYIQTAMAKQQVHLLRCLAAPPDKGASFFNLLRALASQHERDGIAWANLFSFAWNSRSPMRWANFPELLEISERLLKAQIEVLEPDIIIFANGASSAQFRQRYFPYKGDHSVCSEFADYRAQGIAVDQLWQFRLGRKIQCYRIQHPSSISAASRAARRFLLEHVL
ncbi:MAG: hypothetical protein ROZ37_04800 [Aromatoleum sp.]|uniref:hypothetical protein n=1 Tax=Aromatoleum sp. TaxID=2307007 RepID=UPI0028949636|nr:hypothetical protein [Aromatoleum sp.]MDT3669636.1 hypothetical protein [Aromatoleum sp.]